MSTSAKPTENSQSRVVAAIKQTQELGLSAVAAATKAVTPITSRLPALPFADRVPSPSRLIGNAFGFAEELFEVNRSNALRLAKTLSPLTDKIAASDGDYSRAQPPARSTARFHPA